jgi:hypothetical protein
MQSCAIDYREHPHVALTRMTYLGGYLNPSCRHPLLPPPRRWRTPPGNSCAADGGGGAFHAVSPRCRVCAPMVLLHALGMAAAALGPLLLSVSLFGAGRHGQLGVGRPQGVGCSWVRWWIDVDDV